jgi:hypothetical protein
MSCGLKMLGGVFILRAVAAAYVAATQTKAQLNPRITQLQAFLTAFGAGIHIFDLTHMLTG